MATTVYGPGTGVQYTTITNGGGILQSVVISFNGTAIQTITNGATVLPALNTNLHADTTANFTTTIASLLSGKPAFFFDVPGVTGTYNILAAVAGTDQIHIGGTATINSVVSGLSGLTIDVDGGAATYTNLLTAASAFVTNITYGGSFTLGGVISINALAGTSINFGTAGGTFVTSTDSSFINVNLGTTLAITGFDTSGLDKIDNAAILRSSVNSYKIADDGSNQVITFYGSTNGTGAAAGDFVVSGHSLLEGTFAATAANGALTLSTGVNNSLEFTPNVLCFLTGTHIRTETGEVLVETLKIGDEILTADGSVKSVRWVGINTVATRFADPLRFMPIRIKAGALGDSLPIRDLLVSPDHAMLIDGVLIHAAALVNGLTVVREQTMPATFVYYHVEVEDHALLFAEGALAETFVDNADRMAFDNWAEHVALYGEDCSIPEMDYPRAQSSRQVPAAIRASLSQRADRMLGWSLARAA